MPLHNHSLLSQIIGHILGVLFTFGMIMLLLENLFPEWFNKHIKKK